MSNLSQLFDNSTSDGFTSDGFTSDGFTSDGLALLARGNFCRLLQQNVYPDLDSNGLTLIMFMKEFWEKLFVKRKVSRRQQTHGKLSG